MKKILIPGIFIGCISIAGAATVKCIAFDTTKACSIENPGDYPDFYGSCNGITVKGIGYCSQDKGSSKGETSPTLNKNIGVNCWCKMISPAVSQWVYLEGAAANYVNCLHTCSIDCVWALNNSRDSTIRSAMFLYLDN